MYKVSEVNLELTDKCQAACPMCARNFNGGKERPHVKNIDMSLENVQQWFPPEWIKTIDRFVASGNNGDPIIAKDCYKIFEYLIEHSHPNCLFKVFTNGSLRTPEWWSTFAKLLGTRGEVVFAIDGFADQHSLYRRNTSWEKVLENAKAFIAAGGNASVNSLVFKHNEDTKDQLKEFLLKQGFKKVEFIYTTRFIGSSSFPVMNNNGDTEYYLEPPTGYKDLDQTVIPMFNKEQMLALIQDATITPMCYKELYVDPNGNVFPCNHLQRWVNETLPCIDPYQDAYGNLCQTDAINIMESIGLINLAGTNIQDALSKSNWDRLNEFWKPGKKNVVCVTACSDIRNNVP